MFDLKIQSFQNSGISKNEFYENAFLQIIFLITTIITSIFNSHSENTSDYLTTSPLFVFPFSCCELI
jgi:hypothetical protein